MGCLAAAAVAAAAGPARADAGDTAPRVLEPVAYVTPAIAASLTVIVNATAIAYDRPVGRGWRVAGYVCGAVEVVFGAGLLAFRNDSGLRVGLGVVPVVIGAAALGTAFFAPREEVVLGAQGVAVGPLVGPGIGGVVVGGRF